MAATGNERLFDIGEKGLAVHRAVEDHGRSDPVATQPGSEGGGFPMAMGHGGAASLAPVRATVEAGHLGVRGGLVDEDDPRRIEVELSFKPRLARRVLRVATLFGGVRRLFFARDLAALEEPPECADGDGDAALLQPLPQFRQRNVALGGYGRKDQLGMRLDPLRMAVAAHPPPDRARRAHAKSLGRRST